MQFIYLGKAMFYETRISEFLKVSKYLGIKYLSTVIEMNDQTNSNDKETNEHANNAADEDVGAEDPTQTFNEDVANVEQPSRKSAEQMVEGMLVNSVTIKQDT